MRTVNQVILIGNIVKDPMIKELPNGQIMAVFTLATNRSWINKNGEKQTSTEFHNCVAWSQIADLARKYLKKSKLVYVTGYLKTREFFDENTKKKSYRTEIVVLDMILLDKRKKASDEFDLINNNTNDMPSDLAMDGADI